MESTIKAYLAGLEKGNPEAVLTLFAENAVVHSPLYGRTSAEKFYSDLFSDSNESVIQLRDIFTNHKNHSASIFFTYQCTLANGQKKAFDCVDVFQFDEQGKIRELHIIYDTASTRAAFEALQNQKWVLLLECYQLKLPEVSIIHHDIINIYKKRHLL